MAEEQRFPVYRLLGGHIACQLRPGDRWQVVDDALVDVMLSAFDGTALRLGMAVTVEYLSGTDKAGKPEHGVSSLATTELLDTLAR
ncbi:hypothetical protein ABMA32_15965 [Mesorhizobium sp. VNQ89]|uniref:hypothetical protein n=1 Tax=Mesorhizobium quangtriensis TaxID=3157709 RepID=UPI0032B7C810